MVYNPYKSAALRRKAMEIQRDIYDYILNWKNNTTGTKALLIEGARRIGKSTISE